MPRPSRPQDQGYDSIPRPRLIGQQDQAPRTSRPPDLVEGQACPTPLLTTPSVLREAMQATSSSATNQSMQTANNNTLMSQSRSDGKVRFISNHHLSPSLNPNIPRWCLPPQSTSPRPLSCLRPQLPPSLPPPTQTNPSGLTLKYVSHTVFIAFHYIQDQLKITGQAKTCCRIK